MSSWLPERLRGAGAARPAPATSRPSRLGGLRSVLRRDDPAPLPPPARGWSFSPTSWSGALLLILALVSVLWIVQIVNVQDHYALDRFGVRPRELDGLWGVLTQPLLHASWGHLASNTLPLVAIGWVLLLSGVRPFAFVTVVVVLVGGFGTWLVAPSHEVVVGASGLVFGWMGYLIARAWFSRRLRWIVVAIALLVFFGTLLGNLLPTVDANVSWQSHVCGFLAGVGCGWLLHQRTPSPWRRGSARPAALR